MRKLLLLITLGVAVAAMMTEPAERPVMAAACSTSATISATLQVGGPFDGLWKYTIDGAWDTGGEGLSHISFLITYACDCCDVTGLVYFDSPAGTSTGEDTLGNPCTAEYAGFGDLCNADPTIPGGEPAIKFEQNDTSCQAVSVGSGTWIFYSPLPPLAAAAYPNAVAVKYGNNVCLGTLTGQVPDCTDCQTIPVENRTWGKIKDDYNNQ